MSDDRVSDNRPQPPQDAPEIETLRGFLDYQRETLRWKTEGLTDNDLRQQLNPSTMTLGGLIKHLSYVEDYWFTQVLGEAEMGEPWASVDWSADPDWDWNSAANNEQSELFALWEAAMNRSRTMVDDKLAEGLSAMDKTHSAWGGRGRASLRWILVHMIEEYARHNGHADLLRQSVDGQTGE